MRTFTADITIYQGLGRAFMVITNFSDGVLIRGEQGNYITPKNPENFIGSLENKVKGSYRIS